MQRFNPYRKKRPTSEVQRKTFQDDDGQTLDLALTVRPGYNILLSIREKAERYTELYVTGRKDDDGVFVPPAAIIPPGGNAVEVSEDLCFLIARLERMQRDAHALLIQQGNEEVPDPFSFDDWAVIAADSEGIFRAIVDWVSDLRAGVSSAEKNAVGGTGTDTTSAPSSDSDSSTLKLPVGPITS